MTKDKEFLGVDDECMPIELFEFDRASQETECEPNGDAESKEETPAEPAEISTGEVSAEESSEALTVPEHVTGRSVSITSPEFEPVIYKIDDIIARALRTASNPLDQPEPEPYPCEEADCHLCDFGAECDLYEDGTSLVPYEDKHIISAVEDFRCTRKFVRKRYGEIVEEGRSDDQDA